MRILITGAQGFLGSRLTRALVEKNTIGPNGTDQAAIEEIVLTDISTPIAPRILDPRVRTAVGDLSSPRFLDGLFRADFDLIFHLASLVSGGAEKDFEQGLLANHASTQLILEACRKKSNVPTLVFTSSVAVYGGDLPELICDGTGLTPHTSYGTHKAACELLIHDYSRKGYLDGRSIRLPIIIIRPGSANTAASSFASSIFREPLEGRECDCAIHPDDEVYVASAGNAVEGIIRAAESPRSVWGCFSAVMMPGLTTCPREMVDALVQYAGAEAGQLVRWKEDPFIRNIVRAWPSRFDSARARSIGFKPEKDLQAIIHEFVLDAAGG